MIHRLIGIALMMCTLCVGCVGGQYQRQGALLGTGLGALTGAVIGHESGHAEGGAIIGGVIGGLTGSLAGETEDHYVEQEQAIRQASYQQFNSNALRNHDIVMLSQNQVGDEVIRNSIQAQGGRFDLSPEGIVMLKQQGVSDLVIQSMQKSTTITTSLPLPPIRTHRSSVIVSPGFSIIEPHYDYPVYRRPYHHHQYRSGLSIHGHF